MEIRRRTFLKTLGGAAAGITLTRCSGSDLKPVSYLPTVKGVVPGKEEWVFTHCSQCSDACGIKVRVVNGKAIKIEENPLMGQGGLCPKAHLELQVLYDPDRVQGPLKNQGSRGQWAPISWKKAMQTVIKRLRNLREEEESHSLMVICGSGGDLRSHLFKRFCEVYGTPNYFLDLPGESLPEYTACFLTHGYRGIPIPDWKKIRYILSFGAGLLEAGPYTASFLKAYGDFRRGSSGIRGTLIQVEPRFSVTAAKADQWIPIQPGTEGLLALAMAHILIRDGALDKHYIEEKTLGFDKWKEILLRDYEPQRCSRLTGVPMETIHWLAKDLTQKGPAVVLPPTGGYTYTNGVFIATAIYALNALLGNLEILKAMRSPQETLFQDFQPLEKDEISQKGIAKPLILINSHNHTGNPSLLMDVLVEMDLKRLPYQPKALILVDVNPLFNNPYAQNLRQLMERIPFIVSLSSYIDDTSRLADLILPDSTALERWNLVSKNSSQEGLGLLQPVVPAFYNTRPAEETLFSIAKGIGGVVAKAFPWNSCEEMIRDWDHSQYLKSVFNPSGRFQFLSQALGEERETARFAGKEKEFPLYLIPYRNMMCTERKGINSPWALENYGMLLQEKWNLWAEVHPMVAKEQGISDGDWMWIKSLRGRIKVKAHLSEAVRPDTISIPLGLGHEGVGRWMVGRGEDIAKILYVDKEDFSGVPVYTGTRVLIQKA